jgi:hypothetical protein
MTYLPPPIDLASWAQPGIVAIVPVAVDPKVIAQSIEESPPDSSAPEFAPAPLAQDPPRDIDAESIPDLIAAEQRVDESLAQPSPQKIAVEPVQEPAALESVAPKPAPPKPAAPAPIPPESSPTSAPTEVPLDPVELIIPEPTAPAPVTPPIGLDAIGIADLKADYQDFDDQRQVVNAEGNVVLRFQAGVMTADRVQINLVTRLVVGEGRAAFVRGQQRLRGDRIEYNLVQESGQILGAAGELYAPSSGPDLQLDQPPGPGGFVTSPTDRETAAQPLSNITNPGQITINTGFGTNFGLRERILRERDRRNGVNVDRDRRNDVDPNDPDRVNPASNVSLPLQISTFRQEGTVNRWRFQAPELELIPGGWRATNLRLTNDPFSPPQFEIRADSAVAKETEPLVTEIKLERSRFSFDQSFSIPTFRNRLVLDRRPRDAGLFTIGFDSRDRGGMFIERTFEPISNDRVRFNLTPQILVQRAITGTDSDSFLDNFGLRSELSAKLGPDTSLEGRLNLATLNPENFADRTRARIALFQTIAKHTLEVGYSYRTRIFNGSFGNKTVQHSYGAQLTSPAIPIGDTGIVLNYLLGVQRINAETDRLELLKPIRDDNRVDLTRYQALGSLSRYVPLWTGKPLPATPDQGLRFTPSPVVPGIGLSLALSGAYSGYSNGDRQTAITGTTSISGQLGHFSRNWFDSTTFNLTYAQSIRGPLSPFTFDRIGDRRFLGFGITQQVYGPIRFGFQTGIALDRNEQLATQYTIEYSRRAYGFTLNYNPTFELGTFGIRISDFNWMGGTTDFGEP